MNLSIRVYTLILVLALHTIREIQTTKFHIPRLWFPFLPERGYDYYQVLQWNIDDATNFFNEYIESTLPKEKGNIKISKDKNLKKKKRPQRNDVEPSIKAIKASDAMKFSEKKKLALSGQWIKWDGDMQGLNNVLSGLYR